MRLRRLLALALSLCLGVCMYSLSTHPVDSADSSAESALPQLTSEDFEAIHCTATFRQCLLSGLPPVAGRFVSVLPPNEPPRILLHVMHRLRTGMPVSWIRWADGEMLKTHKDLYELASSWPSDLRAAARRWPEIPELYVAVNTAFFCGAPGGERTGLPDCGTGPRPAPKNYSAGGPWSVGIWRTRGGRGFRLRWNELLLDAGLAHRHDWHPLDFFYLPIFREMPWEGWGVQGWLYETRQRQRAVVAPRSYQHIAVCLNATFLESGSSLRALRSRIIAESAAHPHEGVVFIMSAGSLAKLVGTLLFEQLGKDSFIDVGNAMQDLSLEASRWHSPEDPPAERWRTRHNLTRCAGFARGETWRRPRPPPMPLESSYDV